MLCFILNPFVLSCVSIDFDSDQQIDQQISQYNVYETIDPPINGYDSEFDDEGEDTTGSESYSITDDERKRQNHLNEFIATENAYVVDMAIVIDVSCLSVGVEDHKVISFSNDQQVFQKPLKARNCITDAESDAIFVNWSRLVRCNQKSLKYSLFTSC